MEPVEVFTGILRAGQVLAPLVPARTVLHVTNIAVASDVDNSSVSIFFNTANAPQAMLACTLDANCRQYACDLVFPAASNVRFNARIRSKQSGATLPDCEVHLSGFMEVVALPEDDEDDDGEDEESSNDAAASGESDDESDDSGSDDEAETLSMQVGAPATKKSAAPAAPVKKAVAPVAAAPKYPMKRPRAN